MTGWAAWSSCQLAAVRARMRCSAHDYSGRGAPAVAFQVELPFEGVVDRFDDLAQGFEELRAGPFGLALAGRAQ